MNIWITEPALAKEPPLFPRLRALWRRTAGDANLTFMKANPYEIHGQLLTRTWQAILDHSDPIHVISEIDFLPYRTFGQAVAGLVRGGAPCGLCRYATRSPELELKPVWPLVGAWLMVINKDALKNLPPLNWLDAGGEFNDAANLAMKHLLENGCIEDENDVAELLEYDCAPDALGLEYNGFGYHAFFARHFNDDPRRELFPGYTLKQHLADIDARLTTLGA